MLRHGLLGLAGAAAFYFITSHLSAYNDFQAGEVALYAVALAGLSLLTGANGQVSLGHGALMAVGGYTVALLMVHTHTSFALELLASVAAGTVVGAIVGIPASRLRGPYLAGMTLILALALPLLADKYSSIFGGDQGITTVPPAAPGAIDPERWLAWIEGIAAITTLVLLANLRSSRYGRAFRAVRDDDVAAALAGIRVARTRVMAFAVSAACAGLAGALLALSTGVVNTGEFPLSLSIELLAAMVLGGAGSLAGCGGGRFWSCTSRSGPPRCRENSVSGPELLRTWPPSSSGSCSSWPCWSPPTASRGDWLWHGERVAHGHSTPGSGARHWRPAPLREVRDGALRDGARSAVGRWWLTRASSTPAPLRSCDPRRHGGG
jgi:ABC-type branched-subunit amino acid transport system permease subunit